MIPQGIRIRKAVKLARKLGVKVERITGEYRFTYEPLRIRDRCSVTPRNMTTPRAIIILLRRAEEHQQ